MPAISKRTVVIASNELLALVNARRLKCAPTAAQGSTVPHRGLRIPRYLNQPFGGQTETQAPRKLSPQHGARRRSQRPSRTNSHDMLRHAGRRRAGGRGIAGLPGGQVLIASPLGGSFLRHGSRRSQAAATAIAGEDDPAEGDPLAGKARPYDGNARNHHCNSQPTGRGPRRPVALVISR
jgi:hypothetical protein